MKEEFERLKKKYLKSYLIKSIIYALSFSIVLTFILFIIFYLLKINLHILIYIAFFIILGFVSSYFLIKVKCPSDNEIAKIIDKKYELKEQVQTMITFEKDDNQIVDKLKKETEKSLGKFEGKELAFKFTASICFSLFFALVSLSTMIIIYPKAIDQISSSSGSSSESMSSSQVSESLEETNSNTESMTMSNESATDNSNSNEQSTESQTDSLESSDTLSVESVESSSNSSSMEGGDGSIEYAGNDKVFTVNGYGEYGTVIDDYYDKTQGFEESDVSDALAEYFASLYSKNKKEKVNGKRN